MSSMKLSGVTMLGSRHTGTATLKNILENRQLLILLIHMRYVTRAYRRH
jgi:hypothetical protein